MSLPLSYNVRGAVAASGLSKSKLLAAINTGHLRAKRSSDTETGWHYVILHADLVAYLDALVDA